MPRDGIRAQVGKAHMLRDGIRAHILKIHGDIVEISVVDLVEVSVVHLVCPVTKDCPVPPGLKDLQDLPVQQ